MNKVLKKLEQFGIVPVVVLEDAKDAALLAKALCDGGLACAEVTFRTAAAEESIRIMSQKFPEMVVGAGTVLTVEQVDRAVKAGAQFIVSPGFNPVVVKYCIDHEIPITPGVVTPSEMEQAIAMGLEVVKFFPAEPSGGLGMIKAVAAPYTTLKFMPTGGINPENIVPYLQYDKILACGGSWMVKGNLVARGAFDQITELTREAVSLVHSAKAGISVDVSDQRETGQPIRVSFKGDLRMQQIVYCSKCGDIYRRVVWNNRGKRSIVWCCCTRVEHGPGACNADAIHESELQNLVVRAINMALGQKDTMYDVLQRNVEAVLTGTDGISLDEIDARLEELQKELLNVANAKENYDSIVDEIYRLREAKQNAQVEGAEREGMKQRISEMQQFLAEQTQDITEYDEQLVCRLIEKITVYDEKVIVEFKSGTSVDIHR